MNPHEIPSLVAKPRFSWHLDRPWFFTKLFVFVACLAVGYYVGSVGFRAAYPSAPDPDTALCGNCIFGGLLVLYIGAPLSAIAGSIVAGGLGAMVDGILTSISVKSLVVRK